MTRWLVLPLVLWCASCGCSSDSELGSIDEPIHAEVVWRKTTDVEWKGSGHYVVAPTGLKTRHRGILLVKDHDERPLPNAGWDKNTKVELRADEKAERIAYRKAPDEWRVAYVVAKEHVFLDPNTVADLDYAKLPKFADVAIQLFSAPNLNQQGCVLEEVEKSGGAVAVASLLAGTADVESATEWDKAFEKLPAEHRPKVLAELEKKLLRQSIGPAFERALARLDVAHARFAPALLGLVKKLASETTKLPRPNPDRLANRAGLCLRAAAVTDLEKAAGVACEVLGVSGIPGELQSSALLVLTKARAGCPAAERLLEKELCAEDVACLVDPKASDFCPTHGPRKKLETGLKATYRESPFSGGEAFAVWAASLPELPQPIALLKRRSAYAISASGERECPAAKEGAACRPDATAIHESLCRVTGDSGETVAARYRVDDATKRIVDVKSAFGVDYQALVLSDYLGSKLRGCALEKDGTVVCFDRAGRDTGPGRPIAVGLAHVQELEASDRTICARSNDDVRCLELGVELGKATPNAVRLGRPLKEIAAAGLAVCGATATGTLVCQRSKHPPAEVPLVTDLTRLVSTTDAFGVERQGKPPMFVRCDGNSCRATEVPEAKSVWVTSGFGYIIDQAGDVARWKVPEPNGKRELVAVKNLHAARELAVLHEAGCAIDSGGAAWCFGESGVAERVVDKVKSVSIGRHPGTQDRSVLALRTDGSVWTWSIREPKPQPLW
jgi:hypothetical protein